MLRQPGDGPTPQFQTHLVFDFVTHAERLPHADELMRVRSLFVEPALRSHKFLRIREIRVKVFPLFRIPHSVFRSGRSMVTCMFESYHRQASAARHPDSLSHLAMR